MRGPGIAAHSKWAWAGSRRTGQVPQAEVGQEELARWSLWHRGHKGTEDSLNGWCPGSLCQGVGRRGWEGRVVGSLVCQVSSTGEPRSAPRSPPCLLHPVSPTPLVPAARDVLCHLSAMLLKHFSLCFSHTVSSRQESFPLFASRRISPHSSRSSCNASSSLQPSLIATICVNYPFLRIPTLGSWGCCCHPLRASFGGREW